MKELDVRFFPKRQWDSVLEIRWRRRGINLDIDWLSPQLFVRNRYWFFHFCNYVFNPRTNYYIEIGFLGITFSLEWRDKKAKDNNLSWQEWDKKYGCI